MFNIDVLKLLTVQEHLISSGGNNRNYSAILATLQITSYVDGGYIELLCG